MVVIGALKTVERDNGEIRANWTEKRAGGKVAKKMVKKIAKVNRELYGMRVRGNKREKINHNKSEGMGMIKKERAE